MGPPAPVTLKLSKRFYDVFGEQVANELVDAFNQVDATYRSDLKEMNESNFARSDAKQETRFAQFEASVGAKMEKGFREQMRFMLLGWATILAAIIATR